MTDQADMVRAVAFVALCKEWYGNDVLKAASRAAEGSGTANFKHLWCTAGELADVIRRIEATEDPLYKWRKG